MSAAQPTQADLDDEIERCWPLAQAYWSRFLLLGKPIDDKKQVSIAQIDLCTRQVSLNADMILSKNLVDTVEALLAHEIGHHVRFPGSFQTQARLRLLERSLVPFDDYSFINLFTDLMINQRLGSSLRNSFIRVYQSFTQEPAFHGDGNWKRDPAFLFYLAIYEELWQQNEEALIGPAAEEFGRVFPSYRSEAVVLAQNLFNLGPNLYTQFLYFLSVLLRYLILPESENNPQASLTWKCGRGDPSAEDWAAALSPSPGELEAIRRAIEKGWFVEDQAKRLEENNLPEARMGGLPGYGLQNAQLVPEIMAAYYRQQAERYLLRPPPQRRLGELHAPTTLDEWEQGDSGQEIDWLATFMHRGERLGVAAPLKRIRVAEEEGFEAPLWQPRLEIYLDVSGSMPNPCLFINAMTLAAQILTAGTIRAGGWVRALLYSWSPVTFWEWTRSETEISRFLMHYIGGGTEFPFDRLDRSVSECAGDQPIRVVITDRDWDANFATKKDHARIVGNAARASPHFILLLHSPQPERAKVYRELGASVIAVEKLDDFPRLATDLSNSLFPEDRHGSV